MSGIVVAGAGAATRLEHFSDFWDNWNDALAEADELSNDGWSICAAVESESYVRIVFSRPNPNAVPVSLCPLCRLPILPGQRVSEVGDAPAHHHCEVARAPS